MFSFCYNTVWAIGLLILKGLSLFNKNISTFLSEREDAGAASLCQKKYWIHCASLGEFEMIVPLLDHLLTLHNADEILVTFFSPSGYKQIKKGKYKSLISYLPLDTPRKVKAFYKTYNPTYGIFVRYDLWYNFLKKGVENGTELMLINGRFKPNHFIFNFIGKPYAKLLRQFSQLFLSDKASYTTLKSKQYTNCVFTGDTRYDRVYEIQRINRQYTDIKQFIDDRKVLLVGSSWQKEESLVLSLLKNKVSNLAIIIAPHNISRSDKISEQFTEFNPKLYADKSFNSSDNMLIINNIGMLSQLYKYADFALIGGGFYGKLHNILEPTISGTHISYGPNIGKYPEAEDFIINGFGYKIEDYNDWILQIKELCINHSRLDQIKKRSKAFATTQIGATKRILDSLEKKI